MKFVKGLSLLVALTFSLTAAAAKVITPALVMEKCSHDIEKLAKKSEIPAEAMTKLHMMRVKATETGFQVIAVLDHNGDHSQTPGHVRLTYDANAKMHTFEYVNGYVTPNDTPFVKENTAMLFDMAAEVLLDSDVPELKNYASTIEFMELEFDSARKLAEFVMFDSNKKELHVWLDLDGKLIEYKFL